MRVLALLVMTLLPVAFACSGPAEPSCPNDLPASCPTPIPSWSTTVSPIVQEKCWPCHANAQMTGFDFSTYDKVHAQQSEILSQVYHCLMPQLDAGQLDDAQRQALLGWLVCNSPSN